MGVVGPDSVGWVVLPKTRSARQPAATKLASVDDAGVELHWGDIELEPIGVVESYQLCLLWLFRESTLIDVHGGWQRIGSREHSIRHPPLSPPKGVHNQRPTLTS